MKLGEMLVRDGRLSEANLDTALKHQARDGGRTVPVIRIGFEMNGVAFIIRNEFVCNQSFKSFFIDFFFKYKYILHIFLRIKVQVT